MRINLLFIFILMSFSVYNELNSQVKVTDPYMVINAETDDPLFTTYAASKERSRFFADKAYFMNYFTENKPIVYSSQYAGEYAVVWKINNIVISRIRDFIRPPVVVASFPDMAVLKYEPFAGIEVQETFFVYSSGTAVIDMHIQNKSDTAYDIMLYPLIHLPDDSLRINQFDQQHYWYVFSHYESTKRLHSNLYADRNYPINFRNILACNPKPDSYGGYEGCNIQDIYFAVKRFSKIHHYVNSLNKKKKGTVGFIVLQKNIHLNAGESKNIRFVRGVQDSGNSYEKLINDVTNALSVDIQDHIDKNENLFESIPRIQFKSNEKKMVYLGAFNLVRQCILPPRGKTSYNYYVFSRNPIWGWGHGHQVMHESLSMLPYAYVDDKSAQQSQGVYIEQQYDDGLIGYRHGPRGPQVYPHKGKATTSAPFFSWTNWEIYQVSKDSVFLKDAYEAGAKFVSYLEENRDKDGDGLFEWGPYGIIENVRDGWNVVFQLFSRGKDEGRDISNQLDALDLSCQVANEIYHLRLMAEELGDQDGMKKWSQKFNHLKDLINKYMWDEKDDFYYHVAMTDNSFTFEGKSLKRKEIIGFLPLWAHVASKEQAQKLIKHLTNKKTFWRKYGIPTLSAHDPHYTPFVDGCCRWNGPIWLLWDYMVFKGLKNYEYNEIAQKLAEKMMLAVTTQLKKNHRFWESYSPDYPVQECPSNYIWNSIMAKLLIENQ